MMDVLIWIILFIIGYVIIFYAADVFIDNVKEITEIYKVSPLIVGMLILGIDPEESISSIIAGANNLPYIAIGNVIGNSIIAMTIPFTLAAIFYSIKINSVNPFYFILLFCAMGMILIGFFIHYGLLIAGLITIVIYIIYFFYNLKQISKKSDINKIKTQNRNEFSENLVKIEKKEKVKKFLIVSVSLVFIILGGELLIISAEKLIKLTIIPESIFGFIIIAFFTNVEEITLVIKSIQKKSIEIGLGGMIGKLMWNLTITYGFSGILAGSIDFRWILIWNWLILLLIIIYFIIVSNKKTLLRYDVIILTIFIISFLIVNLMLI